MPSMSQEFLTIGVLLSRFSLATIFIIAALTKALDHAGSKRALLDFGVPLRLAPLTAATLVAVEAGIGLALLSGLAVWWAAVFSLPLVLIFMITIGLNMAMGRHPQCHCFGQLHSEPIGWPTLMRNMAFLMFAALIVAAGPERAQTSIFSFFAAVNILPILITVAAFFGISLVSLAVWLLFQILKQQGRILLRLDQLEAPRAAIPIGQDHPQPEVEGLPFHSIAPTFQLPDTAGKPWSLEDLRHHSLPLLLLFVDPDCGPCAALLPQVREWQQNHGDRLEFVLISRGSVKANQSKIGGDGALRLLMQRDFEVALAYRVKATPSAVVIDEMGMIASAVASGTDPVQALIQQTIDRYLMMPKIGEPAPPLRLPDLKGALIDLEDFLGQSVVLLFWNPSCGFCQQMLGDLRVWDKTNATKPTLILVSVGHPSEHQDMHLDAPILLAEGHSAGHPFGAQGSPMAIHIDSEGHIASSVAAGATAILTLLNRLVINPVGNKKLSAGVPGRDDYVLSARSS